MSDPTASAAGLASDPSSGDDAMCGHDCILAFSLASAGMVLAGVLMSIYIVRRRRLNQARSSAGEKHVEQGKGGNGAFDRYRSRLANDDDLVDVLDLFDPPSVAHLRSPGPKCLDRGNPAAWGRDWQFLTEKSGANSPAVAASSTSHSSLEDRCGLRTILEHGRIESELRSSGMYHTSPTRRRSTLERLANAASAAKSGSPRPASIKRDRRPPPLKLKTTNDPPRSSYISIASVKACAANGQPSEKPALSPITPLITPPCRSPYAASQLPAQRMRVPRRLSVNRDDINVRRSIDGAW